MYIYIFLSMYSSIYVHIFINNNAYIYYRIVKPSNMVSWEYVTVILAFCKLVFIFRMCPFEPLLFQILQL